MIHPSAIISPSAKLGKNVSVGQFTTIYDNVVIGDDCKIEGYCELGVESSLTTEEPLVFGNQSHIRSHSIFYSSSNFGDGLTTGHRVTVRERTIAGKGLQIGTLSDIQGDCTFGDYVRLHSNVHIGKLSKIADFVWIFPYVVLTNDPHPPSETLIGVEIGKFAVVATMTVVLPGARVAEGVLVGAHSCLKGETEPDTVYAGSPAKKICKTSAIQLQDGNGDSAYPWRNHFCRGYPEHIVEQWKQFQSDES